MSSVILSPPLVARNGHLLRVLFPCRVSDPTKQDIRSLADQAELMRNWLTGHTDIPFEPTVLEGKESGEWIERQDYLRLIEYVETGQFDLVLTEDVGRIIRRIHAHLFAELCCDFDTRLISINDHVDTAKPGWQDASIFAAWHHERSNRDTSERIKRTHSARFEKGECLSLPIAGIIKPPGATSDLDLRKDPDAEPVYRKWFDMLDKDALFSEVADYLNSIGFPTGPYCRHTRWDGPMVGRTTRNTILNGVRFRGRRRSRRNSKCKYISVKANSQELELRQVPHLAFFDEEYYDRVLAKVNKRTSIYSRKKPNGADPLQGIARKRTRWPGQHVFCGICGRLYVFGGHGQKDFLMCTGAREHKCWNGVSLNGPLAAQQIADAIFEAIQTLPDFDEAFLSIAHEEAERLDSDREQQRTRLTKEVAEIDRQIGNLTAFIRQGDTSQRVREDLQGLESDLLKIKGTLSDLENTPSDAVVIPSIDEVKNLARVAFADFAPNSAECGRLMRLLIPKIVVFPYRLCDGKRLVLRAQFRLQLSRLLPEKRAQEVLLQPLEQVLTVDLFDHPQREAHRRKIVELRAAGMTAKEAAAKCKITNTAGQYAMRLHRMMQNFGLSDPYVPVTEPPVDCTKFRRHLHKRYCFEPRDDAGQF